MLCVMYFPVADGKRKEKRNLMLRDRMRFVYSRWECRHCLAAYPNFVEFIIFPFLWNMRKGPEYFRPSDGQYLTWLDLLRHLFVYLCEWNCVCLLLLSAVIIHDKESDIVVPVSSLFPIWISPFFISYGIICLQCNMGPELDQWNNKSIIIIIIAASATRLVHTQ